jgi:small subunit ribosomal protein S6
MPLYESVYIARQDIPAQEVEALTERFEGIVSEQGGKVARREYWGLKNLAYRVKKNRKGHYTMLHLDAPSEAVQEMERNMRISDDVLRYLTIRVDEHSEEPSIMMQTRSGRDDRGRRDDRRPRHDDGPRSDNKEAKPAAAAGGTETANKPDAEAKPAAAEKPSTETAKKEEGS